MKLQREHLNQYIKFIFTKRISFYSLFYCDRRKFNFTGGFFILLFMVTGRGIFICSAVNLFLETCIWNKVITDIPGKICGRQPF